MLQSFSPIVGSHALESIGLRYVGKKLKEIAPKVIVIWNELLVEVKRQK